VEAKIMRQSRLIGIAGVFLAAALSVPAWATDPADAGKPKATPARPGSLNYIEGQASIEGQSLGPEAIGQTELKPGQSLETQVGKAELLLTPGVFFRLGDNSSVMMISPSLTDTELRLDKGEATVEVAQLHPENNIVIAEGGAKIRLTKTGFYDFDADHNVVRVYEGQATVEVNGQNIEVKNDHQLAFNAGGSMKPEKFDKNTQDDLYKWSSLRSSYLAEANVDRAQVYQMGNWYGAGWDWDPYYGAYTFIPGDGVFYSPFGWGFYSPFDVGFAPFFFFGHFDHDFRHFEGREHGDREHFADRGHGDRGHFDDRRRGDRGHFDDRGHVGDRGHVDGGGHQEAHYYDHVDHGVYHGPGHSDHSGLAGHPGGVSVAGGFHGGNSGAGVHGAGGAHGMGGGGFHGGGGGGAGHAGGGGAGGHGGGGGGGGHH
jgi:hypothetical protein